MIIHGCNKPFSMTREVKGVIRSLWYCFLLMYIVSMILGSHICAGEIAIDDLHNVNTTEEQPPITSIDGSELVDYKLTYENDCRWVGHCDHCKPLGPCEECTSLDRVTEIWCELSKNKQPIHCNGTWEDTYQSCPRIVRSEFRRFVTFEAAMIGILVLCYMVVMWRRHIINTRISNRIRKQIMGNI